MNGFNDSIAIVDATAAGRGKREFTRDAIGCGVRSICGVLEQQNIDSKVFLAEDIIAKGFDNNYCALFISGMSMDKAVIRKIINLWHRNHIGKVVIGGPITSELERILFETKADIIVIGEGEITVSELITKGSLFQDDLEKLKTINGIGFLDCNNNPHIVRYRKYSTHEEFRSFRPSTKRIIDYQNHFSAKVYVECVRGCSNFSGTRLQLPDGRQCIDCSICDSGSLERRAACPAAIPPGCGFCSVPSLFGPARSKQVKDIVQEVKELLNLGVKRIVLSAPDFLDFERDTLIAPKPLLSPHKPPANVEKIDELLANITSLEAIAGKKAWVEVENIKASLFTETVAKILSRYLPNSSFNIGCETGSEKHAIQLGRPSTPNDTLEAVKLAHKYGLHAHCYFIHGLPGQTLQTAFETSKFIKTLSPYIEKVTIYRFRPLPFSAFGDFPEPQPAVKDSNSKIISDAANEVNLLKKRKFVGKTINVIISEPNFHDITGTIAYILSGGPMVAVANSRDKLGEIVTVRITKVLSEKLLQGIIVTNNI